MPGCGAICYSGRPMLWNVWHFLGPARYAKELDIARFAQEWEVAYCYYSQDSREIVRKFPCLEAAKFTDRDRTFWDVLPADVFRRCARQRIKNYSDVPGQHEVS